MPRHNSLFHKNLHKVNEGSSAYQEKGHNINCSEADPHQDTNQS